MGNTIFITEKPSVAQEYKKVLKIQQKGKTDGYIEGFSPVLNKNVQITWAVGHLVCLSDVKTQLKGAYLTKEEKAKKERWKKETLPIFPKNEWMYDTLPSTYKQFQVVKKLYTAKDVDAIYYAGDSGREGIYIQALIRNQIFNKAPSFDEKVVWIDSYTEESILKGIKEAKPYSSYQNMIDSGYERAISDWLIGMNLTQAFTLTSGSLIKTGRVKTPTLAMVVKRQREIDEFVPTDYYGINADIGTKEQPKWKALKKSSFYTEDDLYNESGFNKKEDRDKLLNELNKDNHLTVKEVSVTEKKEFAPYLFNLADLQAYGSKNLHITPAQTLSIVQSLYEKKLTTYPRTDARVLSSAVAKEIQQREHRTVPPKYINDAKITDHYAIIPTGHNATLSGLELAVYTAIKKRYDAIFMSPYIYDSINVTFIHSNGETFVFSGKSVKQLGYKELYGEEVVTFNTPKEGDVLSATFIENDMQTKAPLPYTTGTLILAMEKAGKLIEDEELREQIKTCGIGTSATRANIIEELQKAGYIDIDKKQKISPTKTGKAIIPIIEKFDEQLVNPEKTADMEKHLSDIADGTLKRDEYEKEIRSYIVSSVDRILNENMVKLEKTGTSSDGKKKSGDVLGKCPKCGNDIKTGKFGIYCTGKCGMGFKIYGKELTESQVSSLLSGKSITKKSGKYSNTILPEVVESEWNGKTYYNFKVEK